MTILSLPKRHTIGPLDVIEYAASPEAPVILCFHGYGADARDLAGLAGELRLGGPARWIFPDAPRGMGPFSPGRMWFPVDEEKIQEAQRSGRAWDLSSARPEGLDEAHEAALGLVEALGAPWGQLVLGGFSQGSMVAVELMLKAPEPPRGLFILSGNLVDEVSLRRLAPAKAGTPFFQSHGTMDPLLGYEGGRRLHQALQEAGIRGEAPQFRGRP